MSASVLCSCLKYAIAPPQGGGGRENRVNNLIYLRQLRVRWGEAEILQRISLS